MTNLEIRNSFEKLKKYIENENFKGYDLYDTLNSKINFKIFGKWIPVLAIQFQKRNPINIRPLLGIKKDYNPKGVGLLLSSYSLLYKKYKKEDYKKHAEFLFNWLINNYSEGFSGYCWGYNFPWASKEKYLEAYMPSIVVTSYVCKGVFDYYIAFKDEKALEILKSAMNFILKDLYITENEYGICFSYTTVMKDCCFNASMLGAEVLAKLYYLTKDEQYLKPSIDATNFTLAYQKDNGVWNYSVDVKTGKEKPQIDFHQGFILESLAEIIKYAGLSNKKYSDALHKGIEYYYKEQFSVDGISKWRLPKVLPVEIHNQSQGIITFSKLNDLNINYLNFANKIMIWTINNMQDKKGYFYHQKHKYYNIKIPYMRWSQAWMLLAFTNFLIYSESNE